MKFNAKLRAKNPTYWIMLVVTVAVSIGAQLGIKGEELTTWAKVGHLFVDIVSNPFLLVSVIVTAVTMAISYTDKGVRDTGFVKTFSKVRDDKHPEHAAVFIGESSEDKSLKEQLTITTPKEYSKEEDNEDVDPYHMEDDETFFKDESKPFGIDWDEEQEDSNVDNNTQQEASKNKVEGEDK